MQPRIEELWLALTTITFFPKKKRLSSTLQSGCFSISRASWESPLPKGQQEGCGKFALRLAGTFVCQFTIRIQILCVDDTREEKPKINVKGWFQAVKQMDLMPIKQGTGTGFRVRKQEQTPLFIPGSFCRHARSGNNVS